MRRLCISLTALTLYSFPVFGQLSGVKHVPGDYSTLALAVSALNISGVGSGGVTFNIAANYTETISTTISLSATGTSANPIVFQKDPATVGSNPLITAYTGGTATPGSSIQDGIWRLVGADFVTISNIDLSDNAGNSSNPSTMEYGIGLYKASSADGCKNVRIEGCHITLNRINNTSGVNPMTDGSAGILVMNSTATAAIVVLASAAGGANSSNKFYSNVIQNCNIGISIIGVAAPSPFTNADTDNDIGGSTLATGNTILNFGGAPAASNPANGIRTLNQYNINISNNTINNNNGSGVNHVTTLRGIYNNTATSASATISGNFITMNGGGTTTNVLAIENAAGSTPAGNTISISDNSIINGTYSTATTGSYYSIFNTASPANLAVNNNIIFGNSTASTSGNFYGISSTGAVTTTININGNQVGNGSGGAVTFTGANSGSQIFINNTMGTSTAALSISNNNFQGISYPVTSGGTNTYISNSAATLSQTISGNTFTNLNVNITSNVTFISNSVILSVTGTQNVSNNSIVTGFTKTGAGGTVTLFTTTATSLGGISNHLNNNFSNINLTGATVMAGWITTDAGSAARTIQGNIFSNWATGSGAVNGMNVNITGINNAITGNQVFNVAGGGNVTGITTAAGNDKISGNVVHTLSTTGPSTVNGILITGGTSKNVYGNKIYDVTLNNAGGTALGISVTGTTVSTANIYNNLIGDLKAPIASTTNDVIRGIGVTTTSANATINVYYNTVYINATSSGVNFSTTGVYHTTSATATTAKLNLRNNILSNTSTPNGTGVTVAYRRSSTALNNYASTSNNNLFYAGAVSANHLVFYDGTNSDQTLASFKTRVTAIDAASVTEDLITASKFVSTSGSSSFFLHIDPAKTTQVESGGANISNFTSDFDGNVRQGNPGYGGTGTAPDIGADEADATRASAFSGTVSVGAGQSFTSLTGADGLFANINSLGLSGNTIVNITSDLTEDGLNSLFAWSEQGVGNYILTIQSNTTIMRNVTGNVLSGLIRVNGTKRLVIDGGRGATTNYLAFTNTNTAGTTGTAFTFVNGASSNTIKYCNISAYANATNGVILFSTSNSTSGNNTNTISNNAINGTVAGNSSSVCIYSAGTVGKENTGNLISNNTIFNYRDRGFDIPATGSTAWTISGNSFFNGGVTGSIDYAVNSILYGIKISGGSGYSITGNYVGGSAALAGGSNASYSASAGLLTYEGIMLSTTSAIPASSIRGNTIAGITMSCVPNNAVTASSVFMGIETAGSGISIGGTLAGEGNLVGSNTVNGSIAVTTTTALTTHRSNVRGINCSSTGGSISGNQVGGIDIRNIGAAAAPTTFIGVYVNGVTAPTPVTSNVVGSTGPGAASNSIRVLSTSASTTTTLTGVLVGGAVTSTVLVDGNIVQNMSFQLTAATGTTIIGIGNTGGSNSVVTISNNIVTGNTSNASTGGLTGLYSNGSSSSATIINNTVSSNINTATTTGSLYGINTVGVSTPTITINNNTISGNSTATLTTGIFAGIYNTATATTLGINTNTITGNSTTAVTGGFYPIYNSGPITSAITINANNIGNASSGPITFNAANSATQLFINNTGGAATANLSITNNNFQGINYAVQGTGNNYMILNSAATLSQTITGNTFTNLNINLTNAVTFISNSVVLGATGSQNVNNNSIVGTFTKTAGGTVTLFTSVASSLSGAVANHHNNNFSGITLNGATTMAGWIVTDAGGGSHTIQNNIFSNLTGGTNALTVMSINTSGSNNSVSNNTITNISSSGVVTGIATAGNESIFRNDIHTFTSSGNSAVAGVNITAGTSGKVYGNKIYDLQSTHATGGSVSGILVSGSTLVGTTVFNNLIGDLRSPNVSSATDLVRGINITATAVNSVVNIYYNTIYLAATSSGTNFSCTGIFHTANATSTTASLNLRNNIIANYSTPKGTGLAVAFRRSATSLNNYALTSNNNLFYAGTPGATRLVYYDGTNADQTIITFKARVTTREVSSVTEDMLPKLLSTAGSSALFLHVNSSLTTLIESGAVNITGFTDDFDGQVRAGNPGFTGSSISPDIGADEIFGIETIAPVITYTLLSNTSSTSNVNFTGISITDASGVNVVVSTKPRVYYKRSTDANAWIDNTATTNGWKFTEASNGASPFAFTIDYSLLFGGAVGVAGVIQYFVVAQDNATVPNVGINSGVFANTPSSVSLTSTAFALTGTINSYAITFSGNYNVGNAEVFTSFTRSNGLFAAINSVGLNGNVTISVTSDLSEDGAVALNQWTESGAGNYTLTLQPDAAILRTISGNAPSGLIRFNDADRVNIDGRNGGSGSYLKFVNTNSANTAGTAFTFINGASNNTIHFIDIQAAANSTNGTILFSTSTTTSNSNNVIDNCTISSMVAGVVGNVAIYSAGTVSKENSNTVSNNSIHGYQDRAIDITSTGSTAWTISANSLYNGDVSGTINYAASSTLHGIRILGGSGYSVVNNYIGGTSILASGANAIYSSSLGNVSYQGILLTTSTSTPASNVKGNTIAAISISSIPTSANATAFVGIETNGSGISVGGATFGEGNTVGSGTANSSIVVSTSTTSALNTNSIIGINCNSAGGSVIGNQVAGFDIANGGSVPGSSTIQGIRINSSAPASPVSGNVIGSTGSNEVSNSIRIMPASTSLTTSIQGIVVGPSVTSAVILDNNVIQNVSSLSTTSSGSFIGINNTAATIASVSITNNSIRNISTVSNSNVNSTIYTAIFSQSLSTISSNVIDNFSIDATGTAAQARGISVSGGVAHTISANSISNFSIASTKTTDIETGDPSAFALAGIINSAGAAGQVITGNTIYNLNTTSVSTTNVAACGIAAVVASGAGNIYQNRVHSITNSSTGTVNLPGISGISAFNGLFNVYNNAINLDNSSKTNAVRIYGISHSTTTAWNYYFNSISISGNASGAARSAGFIRNLGGVVVLRNNILLNTRTGPGPNFAISSPITTSWSSSTSDYNDLYGASGSTTGQWGASTQTFAQWITSSGGDTHSVNKPVSFVVSTHDLQPNPIGNCTLDNTGIAITNPIAITTDINNVTRNVSQPDIGAYEFSYSATTVIASNNSPVCASGLVALSVDPGTIVSPTFGWTNPLGVVVSTQQSPSVTATNGDYTVTVTDATGCAAVAATTVSTIARPTAVISGSTTICRGSSAIITLDVTGIGSLSGVLSNGDGFNGTSPQVAHSVSPTNASSYTVVSLSDDNCASLPADLTGTVTISVTQTGEWIGAADVDWNNPSNWCGGVPAATTNVRIVTGTLFQPSISSAANCGNLTIDPGALLSMTSSGDLNIKGDLTNNGNLNAATGTLTFSGSTTQDIVGNIIDFYNINVNTLASGLRMQSSQNILGVLTLAANAVVDLDGSNNTSVFTLRSSADSPTQDAAIAALPSGAVVNGTATVERFMTKEGSNSARIYRYISSPVQNGTVADIQNEIPVTGSFTGTSSCTNCSTSQTMFAYDETVLSDVSNNGTIDLDDGYTDFPLNANTETLTPGRGYALFVRGNILTSTSWNITGQINSGPVALPVSYTSSGNSLNDGWNLVGNPYPSAIDWNSVTWTKTNLNASIYITDNGNLVRQYATWNGVTGTNGGSRYIATGQGFWVKANGSGTPSLTATETVKATVSTTFLRESQPANLMRITMTQGTTRDEAVIHFRNDATAAFDGHADAIKLPNESFNISSSGTQGVDLAINSMPLTECSASIKLKITDATTGVYQLDFSGMTSFDEGVSILLTDNFMSDSIDIVLNSPYTFSVTSNPSSYGANRFVINFEATPVYPTVTNVNVCHEGIAELTATGAPDLGYYNWYDGSDDVVPIAGQHNSTFTTNVLSKSREFFVSVVNNWGCESGRKAVMAEVSMQTIPAVTNIGGVLFSNYPEGNQWYQNDSPIVGATGNSFVPVDQGNYKVQATTPGCQLLSPEYSFVVTGLEEERTNDIKIAPNPVIDKLIVHLTFTCDQVTEVRIASQLGQIVGIIPLRKTHTGSSGEFMMNHLAPGIYLLQVVGDGFIRSRRIVKI